jgi:hypothetical protein
MARATTAPSGSRAATEGCAASPIGLAGALTFGGRAARLSGYPPARGGRFPRDRAAAGQPDHPRRAGMAEALSPLP